MELCAQHNRLQREAEQHRESVMRQGTQLAARLGSRIVARYNRRANREYEELRIKAILTEVFKPKEVTP
jgi:hypothetical protein